VLALLRTPRWLGFSALVVAVIVAFGLLSLWQWSRAEDRRTERVALQERMAATPVPLTDLLAPGVGLPSDQEWRPVVVEGRYETPSLLVRRKPQAGQNGLWVMTRLVTDAGSTVWVNRGWLAADDAGPLVPQTAPAAPTGRVTVVGRLRPVLPPQGPTPSDVPAGQITAAATDQLLPAASYTAYLELTAAEPPTDLIPVAAPQVDEVRNISYAVQWILFAAVAMVGWWFFLRREARDDATASERASASREA